jgi:hypothetical protein
MRVQALQLLDPQIPKQTRWGEKEKPVCYKADRNYPGTLGDFYQGIFQAPLHQNTVSPLQLILLLR